jgi:hypothetical protein
MINNCTTGDTITKNISDTTSPAAISPYLSCLFASSIILFMESNDGKKSPIPNDSIVTLSPMALNAVLRAPIPQSRAAKFTPRTSGSRSDLIHMAIQHPFLA